MKFLKLSFILLCMIPEICFIPSELLLVNSVRQKVGLVSTDFFKKLYVQINFILLTVCYYHVMYAFQSKSTLYSCLNVKELLARNRRDIWNLSDCNGTRTHNHLVRKPTLNHLAKLASLAKWLNVRLQTKCLWVQILLLSFILLVIPKKSQFWSLMDSLTALKVILQEIYSSCFKLHTLMTFYVTINIEIKTIFLSFWCY